MPSQPNSGSLLLDATTRGVYPHMAKELRILLAGGSGLMGEPAARALRAAGHAVTVLTRGARPVPDGVDIMMADRRDERSLGSALRGRSFDLTVDLLAYDAADVARLLDAPQFEPGRYVMISTGQVYLIAAEPRPPFSEAAGLLPAMAEPEGGTRAHANWEYGVGKRAAEAELARRRAAFGLSAVALRLPVVQGARDGSRRLWAYLQRLLDGGPVLLPEGGDHPVRFVWAEDVARALVLLASGAPSPSPAYNLAMPDEPTLADLVSRIAACAGIEPVLVPCRTGQLVEAGLDHSMSPFSGPWCSRPDPALARLELGFACTPSGDWLPEVVHAHLTEPEPESHAGYARRALEIELAQRLQRQ